MLNMLAFSTIRRNDDYLGINASRIRSNEQLKMTSDAIGDKTDRVSAAQITGWGVGVGIGPPTPSGGIGAVVTWWKRIKSEDLPLWMRGIAVPDNQP